MPWMSTGFDVSVTYTVPVPAGMTAIKQVVTIGHNIPRDQIMPTLESIAAMMRDIAVAFAEADPYRGWAPFSFGTSVQPVWVETPGA